MQPFRKHQGRTVALDRVNVDTDQIIPKQFLKRIERTGFGEFLFYDWRRTPEGKPNESFVLNHPRHQGASVLIVDPRLERPVEDVSPGRGRAVATQEDQARRVDADRERQRVRLGACRQRMRGVDGDLVGEREILTLQDRCQLRGMHPVVFGNRVREFPEEFLFVDAKDRRMNSSHGEARWPAWKGLQSAAKRILPHRENLMQYTLVINVTCPCRCSGAC